MTSTPCSSQGHFPVHSMKTLFKPFGLASAAAFMFSLSAQAQTSTYKGNNGGSFGGQLGGSTLTIAENTGTGLLTFSFTPGGSGGFNNIAFYIDSGSGGVTSSTQIADTGGSGAGVTNADAGQISISADSNVTGQAHVNFATGFAANFAIALDAGGNANLFSLSSGNTEAFVYSANYTVPTSSAGPYVFSLPLAQIGVAPSTGKFTFVADLSNSNADGNGDGAFYLSNETIGTSSATVTDGSANPGNTGTLVFSTFDTFPAPEPSTWAMTLGGLGLLIGFRRIRRRA